MLLSCLPDLVDETAAAVAVTHPPCVRAVPARPRPPALQIHACGALVGFLDGFEDIEEAEEGDNGAADAAKAAQQAALAPFVAPLAAALLGLLQPASPPLLLEGCLDVVTRVAERTGVREGARAGAGKACRHDLAWAGGRAQWRPRFAHSSHRSPCSHSLIDRNLSGGHTPAVRRPCQNTATHLYHT